MIPRFINALLAGRSPIVFGDGEQSRDFTYVDNVVEANMLAMGTARLDGEAINIACGKRTSLNQLLGFLRDMVGSKALPIHGEPRRGDVRHSLAEICRGKRILAYEPKVDVATGLRKTVEYFKKQKTVRRQPESN